MLSFCTLLQTCPAVQGSPKCDATQYPQCLKGLLLRSVRTIPDLALYQPDIAQNTGTLLRLGACLGVRLHIILPAGFPLGRRELKRGALDYLDQADWTEHDSYEHFSLWRKDAGRRLVLLTTKTSRSIYEPNFAPDDVLMLGRESAGVPDSVAAEADLRLRIPMRTGMRSINVAVAGAMVLGEALRQTGAFKDLQ